MADRSGHDAWYDILTCCVLEELPIHIHGRLRVYLDRNMGGPPHDPYEHFDEWWDCWCDLGISHRFHWLFFRLSFYRRNGLYVSFTIWRNDHTDRADNRKQGTYVRWTISLGE